MFAKILHCFSIIESLYKQRLMRVCSFNKIFTIDDKSFYFFSPLFEIIFKMKNKINEFNEVL